MVIVDQKRSLYLLETAIASGKLDTSSWGKGTAKTEAHLRKEIDETDTNLVPFTTPDGQQTLLRQVTSATVFVFAQRRSILGRTHLYQLVERGQLYKRWPPALKIRHNAWVSEKKHQDEVNAEKRALFDELKVSINQDRIVIPSPEGKKKKPKKSKTFPNLWDEKTIIPSYTIFEGKEVRMFYYENQPDKITFFSWKRADRVRGRRARMFTEEVTADMAVDSRRVH